MGYKISIITPVYNAATYLPCAFASLQAQTIGFENLQVIFADDCSTDESWPLLQQYAKQYPNVTVLRTQSNSGSASVPRNLALEAVQAPYVMFLDNDDFYEANACEALWREAQSSGTDLVTGYFRDVQESGAPINERNPSCEVTEARKEYTFPQDYSIMHHARMIFWCKIYKTTLIQQHRMRFKPASTMEDVLFLAQYLMACKNMVYIDVLVYNFVARATSLSRSFNRRYIQNRGEDYQLLLALYQKAGHEDCFNAEGYGLANFYLGLIYTSKLVKQEERFALLEAWRPLVAYTLAHDLYVHDDEERGLMQLVAQGEFVQADTAFPSYFLYATVADRDALQQNCTKLNEMYQSLERIYKAAVENEVSYSARLSVLEPRAEILSGQVRALRQELFSKQAKMDEMQARIEAIHRSRLFKLACKISSQLRQL